MIHLLRSCAAKVSLGQGRYRCGGEWGGQKRSQNNLDAIIHSHISDVEWRLTFLFSTASALYHAKYNSVFQARNLTIFFDSPLFFLSTSEHVNLTLFILLFLLLTKNLAAPHPRILCWHILEFPVAEFSASLHLPCLYQNNGSDT